MRLIESIWRGDSPADSVARAVLAPFEVAYHGIISARNALYDRRILPVQESKIPTISVGNLTVGGTGKTPVAAWIAARLRERGKSPAIVMRGYGDDEPEVHRRLNPGIPVIVNADRVAGIEDARMKGATIAILDDAFQHRRAHRSADIVLISADDWNGQANLLPAGPFRESLSSLGRASLAIVTRKSADSATVEKVEAAVRKAVPKFPIANAHLSIEELVDSADPVRREPLHSLSGKRVLAIAAVGNPDAFFRQLEAQGASVIPRAFPDHHAFTSDDARSLANAGRDAAYVVCTLKDAVKLAPLWPAGNSRLWYVSLAVRIERGSAAIDDLLSRF